MEAEQSARKSVSRVKTAVASSLSVFTLRALHVSERDPAMVVRGCDDRDAREGENIYVRVYARGKFRGEGCWRWCDAVGYAPSARDSVRQRRLRDGCRRWLRVCWWQAGYQATGDKERGWPMAALKIPLRLTRLVSRAKERDRDRLSL